jgi:hypothetical protein
VGRVCRPAYIDSVIGIGPKESDLKLSTTLSRFLMALFSGILLLGSTVEAGTLRVAYSAISGAWRLCGVAQDRGYF